MTAYSAGTAWPFERTKRSRYAQSGRLGPWRIRPKKRQVTRPITDSGPPGCPLPALCNISIMAFRKRLALDLRRAGSAELTEALDLMVPIPSTLDGRSQKAAWCSGTVRGLQGSAGAGSAVGARRGNPL